MGEDQKKDNNENVRDGNSQNFPSKSIDFDVTVFFKKDKDFIFIYKKIEKIVAALYLVTNFLEDREPLKWNIRNLGATLLKQGGEFRENEERKKEYLHEKIKTTILEMVSLLDVAFFGHLISEMNAAILKKEFFSLLSHISSFPKNSHLAFERNFFDQIPLTSAPADKETESKAEEVSRTFSSAFLKDRKDLNEKRPYVAIKNPSLKDFSPVSVKKNQRKSVIINLLKKKKEIMITDVTEYINNCSEKTIQRELISLVRDGVLKKTGERRWTKYSLA